MSNTTQLTEFEIFQTVSGNFLCQEVPDDWLDFTEEEQIDFVQEHLWQPLEYCEASKVINLIQDASKSLIALLSQKNIRALAKIFCGMIKSYFIFNFWN